MSDTAIRQISSIHIVLLKKMKNLEKRESWNSPKSEITLKGFDHNLISGDIKVLTE